MAIEKNNRDAFLYFDPHPKSPEDQFAQCSTCRMFVPEDAMDGKSKFDLCIVHGSKQKVGPDYSCGLYAVWPKGKPNPNVIADHAEELKKGLPGSVTAEESGLVERQVRCGNCVFFDEEETECGLYRTLNKHMPDLWDLDVKVDPHGCCNANTAKPSE